MTRKFISTPFTSFSFNAGHTPSVVACSIVVLVLPPVYYPVKLNPCDLPARPDPSFSLPLAMAPAPTQSSPATVHAIADNGQTGGVFVLHDSSQKLPSCVLKPLHKEGFRRLGLRPGEGALREEVAYVIDAVCGGQAGVPVTTRALMRTGDVDDVVEEGVEEGGKRLVRGAIQAFVASEGTSADFGMPRSLDDAAAFLSVDAVQAIACLDIRSFNTDRHEANLLIAKEPFSASWFQRLLGKAAKAGNVGGLSRSPGSSGTSPTLPDALIDSRGTVTVVQF